MHKKLACSHILWAVIDLSVVTAVWMSRGHFARDPVPFLYLILAGLMMRNTPWAVKAALALNIAMILQFSWASIMLIMHNVGFYERNAHLLRQPLDRYYLLAFCLAYAIWGFVHSVLLWQLLKNPQFRPEISE